MHTGSIQETTVNETISTFSVIHDILGDCSTHVDKTEANNAREKLVFESVAVHFWNYHNRDIHHRFISEAASTILESLRAAQKRLSNSCGSRPTEEPHLNIGLDGGWLAEGWWAELFPDASHEHIIQTIASASPTQSGGDLAIEFNAGSDD